MQNWIGRKLVCAIACAALMTACAARVAPPLTGEQRALYGIERVSLTLAPDVRIWWRDGELALAEADGLDTSELDAFHAFAALPDTRKRLGDRLLAQIEGPIAGAATAALYGPQPAQLSVVITDAVAAAGGEIALFGGTHRIIGVTRLFDIETGAALSEPALVEAIGGGGGGLFGFTVDAVQGDPMQRNAEAFGALLGRWLTAHEPVALTSSADTRLGQLPPIPSPVVTAPLDDPA